MPETNAPTEISEILLAWYDQHGRSLPWRQTSDPYCIWISEIILQQTRIAQGQAYYNRFIGRFPDIASLASADEDEVLRYWQGLGYYSRARNLHKAALHIMTHYGGLFPQKHEEILALPGIGPYTAAAISSAAYGQCHAAVDGNVYRVLARLFDADIPIDSTPGQRYFADLAALLIPSGCPGKYNQAVMDFGALQCTPGQPDCTACPLQHKCLAYAHGNVTIRPVKRGKAKSRNRYFHYLHIICQDDTWIVRREHRDIWQGLYEFPLIETESPVTPEELQQNQRYTEIFGDIETPPILRTIAMPKHVLSHQVIYASFHLIETKNMQFNSLPGHAIRRTEIPEYAVPRLIESYLERYGC